MIESLICFAYTYMDICVCVILHLLFICVVVYRRRRGHKRRWLVYRRGSRFGFNRRSSRFSSTTCRTAKDLRRVVVTEASLARWTGTAGVATGIGKEDTAYIFTASIPRITDTVSTTDLTGASTAAIVTAYCAVTRVTLVLNFRSISKM
jgi:hypothetical protein